MRNAHSPNQQNERLDTAILTKTRDITIGLRGIAQDRRDAFPSVYPNRAERRALKKSFNKESIADLDLIGEGSPEAKRFMLNLPRLFQDIPFDSAIKALKKMGQIQLRHGYDPATKKQTAIHESGHIVAVQALGIRTKDSRIWRTGGIWQGFTSWEANYSTATVQGIILRGITILAGWRAEILNGLSHPSSSLDERFWVEYVCKTADQAQGFPPDTTMRATEYLTDHILTKHKPTLNVLADALLANGILVANEIEGLLSSALNDKEFQQLVRSKTLGGVNHA